VVRIVVCVVSVLAWQPPGASAPKSALKHAQCEEAAKARNEYLTNYMSCWCMLLQLDILANNRSHEVARFGYRDCILFSFALRKLSFRAAITIFSSRVYYLFVSRLDSNRGGMVWCACKVLAINLLCVFAKLCLTALEGVAYRGRAIPQKW